MADENSLPGYDGATSIDGITRAILIATHAYMTGEVVSRATALKGASVLLKPARQGSFIFDLLVMMEMHPATTGLAAALTAAPFYDFIKTAFKRATGVLNAEPETKHLQRIYSRKQPPPLKRSPADLDVLAETLEGSLQAAHRPIGIEGTIDTITISARKTKLVQFDEETKGWVNTRDETPGLERFRGNVTRYNSISRNGRAFIDKLEKVVPIRPDGDFPTGDLAHLTWSLHGSNVGAHSKIDMHARRVISASGKVKRLLLADCARAPQK
ncbi:hypothetical protein [Salipiger sp.]|uniref:DUF7946 domain-containing protein n=1 Tax=Salipiger sp. TaxID=2078585 RepID=UPI003A96EC49